jgi:hypothetical protein
VIPADPAETNRQVELLKVLKRQHVEMQQLTDSVTRPFHPPSAATSPRGDLPRRQHRHPHGSALLPRADALLDRQFWAPDDPQKHPYDDTGWSFTALFNVKVVRITDPAILKAR